jgi:hypothetical protein
MTPNRSKPPGKVWAIVAIGGLQAVGNLVLGVLLFVEIGERIDHGQDTGGAVQFGALVSLITFFALTACVVLLARGVAGARVPIAVVEGLSILGALITVATAASTGGELGPWVITGFALPVGMLVMLFSDDVTRWLDPPTRVVAGARRTE